MERRTPYLTRYQEQQYDLIALEREIWNELRRTGATHTEIMAALIDLEDRQQALLAYAQQWDAMAAQQRMAEAARKWL